MGGRATHVLKTGVYIHMAVNLSSTLQRYPYYPLFLSTQRQKEQHSVIIQLLLISALNEKLHNHGL